MDIKKISVDSPDALKMIGELSSALIEITGKDGAQHFHPEDMKKSRAVFTVAYSGGNPVGCGGLREYDADTAEVKRLYAKYRGQGIGHEILSYLENCALELGYSKIVIQTKNMNTNAVAFYSRCGYTRCESFGVYRDMPEAVCFYKLIHKNSVVFPAS